jgi:hypothetical protein
MPDAPPKTGQTVRFVVSDLVHPHPARVLMEMFQNLSLEGEVAAETTDGEASYLVVRVKGLADPVIVPLTKTQLAEPASCTSTAGT